MIMKLLFPCLQLQFEKHWVLKFWGQKRAAGLSSIRKGNLKFIFFVDVIVVTYSFTVFMIFLFPVSMLNIDVALYLSGQRGDFQKLS